LELGLIINPITRRGERALAIKVGELAFTETKKQSLTLAHTQTILHTSN